MALRGSSAGNVSAGSAMTANQLLMGTDGGTSVGTAGGTAPSGMTPIVGLFQKDFTADLGTVVTLNGLTATQSVTGLLTTDQCVVNVIGTLPVGVAIGNAYCSVNGTLSVRFITAVVGNVALGSLTYRLTVFR